MITCEDIRELVEDYLAGSLPGERQAAVAEHLTQCPKCAALLREERLAAALLRDAGPPVPPANLAAHINSAARTYLKLRQRPIHHKALGSPAFFATCASLFCGGIICLVAILRVAAVPAEDRQPLAPMAGRVGVPVRPSLAPAPSRLARPVRPSAATREQSPPMAWLASLPGGRWPRSLVARYPAPPALETLVARPGSLDAQPASAPPRASPPRPD